MRFFRRKQPVAPILVEEIVAGDAFSRLGNHLCLLNDVQVFITDLLTTGQYPRSALPKEGLLSAAVSTYLYEVSNGGHAQFIGNTDWDPELRDDIREGLALIGLEDVAAIFADFEAYARAEPAKFHAAEWNDPSLNALDYRLYALLDDVELRHAEWLMRLPMLRIVPDADFPALRKALVDLNRTGSAGTRH